VDKHGAKILRGTPNTAEQSVILLIFKDFQKSGGRSVENRSRHIAFCVLLPPNKMAYLLCLLTLCKNKCRFSYVKKQVGKKKMSIGSSSSAKKSYGSQLVNTKPFVCIVQTKNAYLRKKSK
jgi:hypothetical protein